MLDKLMLISNNVWCTSATQVFVFIEGASFRPRDQGLECSDMRSSGKP